MTSRRMKLCSLIKPRIDARIPHIRTHSVSTYRISASSDIRLCRTHSHPHTHKAFGFDEITWMHSFQAFYNVYRVASIDFSHIEHWVIWGTWLEMWGAGMRVRARIPNKATEKRRAAATKNFISNGTRNPCWNRTMIMNVRSIHGMCLTFNHNFLSGNLFRSHFTPPTPYTKDGWMEVPQHHGNSDLAHIWRRSLASARYCECGGAKAEFFNISHGTFEHAADWYGERCNQWNPNIGY